VGLAAVREKGRSILLSIHFIDEVDILGSRIAIMAIGDLKAVGSSFFLKKKIEVVYRLICVKESGWNPEQHCCKSTFQRNHKKYL
jgi:ATP-binding cassette, subfamily A (ABC1), member 3